MPRMAWENDADVEFDEIVGHLNALNARMVTTARWLLDNPSEWQGDGVWTPEAYICWRTGVVHATAKKIVDIARRSDDLPETIATMQRGELSLDQVTPIARHAPAWADRQMAGLAPNLMATQISRVARRYTWTADDGTTDHGTTQDGTATDAGTTGVGTATDDDAGGSDSDSSPLAHPDREAKTVTSREPDDQAWYGWGDDGRFRLHLEVGADTGGLLETALEECHDRLFHERTDTDSVSVVDAVVEMAARSIDAVPSEARRNRFRANFFIDASTATVSDRRGRPVPHGPARRVLCDTLASPVEVVNGLPVSVGRSQHIVPDRTRRLVEHRDGGCRVPGCPSDRFVEVHHVVHWSDGGASDTENLLCLCPKHHRLHHQGRLDISGNADRPPDTCGAVEFRDRHGIPIRASGANPIAPTRPPPPITGTWEHPRNERLDVRYLHIHEPAFG